MGPSLSRHHPPRPHGTPEVSSSPASRIPDGLTRTGAATSAEPYTPPGRSFHDPQSCRPSCVVPSSSGGDRGLRTPDDRRCARRCPRRARGCAARWCHACPGGGVAPHRPRRFLPREQRHDLLGRDRLDAAVLGQRRLVRVHAGDDRRHDPPGVRPRHQHRPHLGDLGTRRPGRPGQRLRFGAQRAPPRVVARWDDVSDRDGRIWPLQRESHPGDVSRATAANPTPERAGGRRGRQCRRDMGCPR